MFFVYSFTIYTWFWFSKQKIFSRSDYVRIVLYTPLIFFPIIFTNLHGVFFFSMIQCVFCDDMLCDKKTHLVAPLLVTGPKAYWFMMILRLTCRIYALDWPIIADLHVTQQIDHEAGTRTKRHKKIEKKENATA